MGRDKKCQLIYEDKKIRKYVVDEYKNGKSIVQISKENNFPYNTLRVILKEENVLIRSKKEYTQKFYCNENFFDDIDNENKAYWLGFFYADGYICNKRKYTNYKIGITLSEKDKCHLEKFKKDIEYTGEIKTYANFSSYSNNPYSRIIITSDKLAISLIKKGCLLNKTKELFFPSQDVVPLKFQKDFIRGLIDGDGSLIILRNGEYKISFTGTYEICKGILDYFGYENKINHNPKKKEFTYYFSIGGKNKLLNFLDQIYENSTIYLDRKYEIYRKMKCLRE